MDFCKFNTYPFTTFLYILNFTICFSINHEGLALLRFKDKLESDPFRALSTWTDQVGIENPCSWFGVGCSENLVISLDLKNLCLKGTLPSELGELIHIKSIILRNNSFSGSVQEEILSLEKLQVLDIGYNNFSGEFPYPFRDDSSMSIVLLDHNEHLESRHPKILKLQKLYEVQTNNEQAWSCNELASIPWNTRTTQNKVNVPRRRSLQEPSPGRWHSTKFFPFPDSQAPFPLPFQPPALDSSPAPTPAQSPTIPGGPADMSPSPSQGAPASSPLLPTRPSRRKHHLHHRLLKILADIGGAALLLLVIGIVLWQCGNVATVKPWATGLSGQLQRAFITGVPKLRRSELEAACEDFSNAIGSSPFLSLYKGTLSNGTEIAVASVAVASSKGWSNTLESQFRDKITTLSNVNHKNFTSLVGYCIEDEPFTRMMVFEYAPNGTLFEHLHIREAEHLDWPARLRIAMGIAYCLDYLHQLSPPFSHKNLTSSTIYLTEDYAAKVADFALCSESSSFSEPEPSASSNVYEFGVVLFEMMTGRLPNSVLEYLMGTRPLREMVDPTLETYDEDRLQQIGDAIRFCTDSDPRRRPAMGEVCTRLREVTGIDPDGAVPRLSPLWWAEVEIMSADAS